MLENQMIIRAGMKRHKGSLFGIAILMFLTALSLTAVLMIAFAGNSYIREEMERAGFGDLTAWTADVPDMEFLLESIREQEGVEAAEVQRLIFSEYEAKVVESDSEGQMIPWVSSESGISTRSRYRFFENNLSGYAKAPEEIGEQTERGRNLSASRRQNGKSNSIQRADAGTQRKKLSTKHRGQGAGIQAIRARGLTFHLALRQVLTGRRRYVSACLVAAMLVFFASLAGRINGWLGTDGKGMMDAFNPADLDLGVQVLGKLPAQEMEQMVLSYTDITDSYMLAMPSVSVNGTNYTANVITEPERFHISAGQTCMGADEVVLTEALAADLGVGTGDTVTIRGNKGSREFRVSGIYHCANDMGANLGMSREGYLSIGEDDSRLWCYHYFLSDPSRKQALTEELEQTYGGDVHVHENSWPGLFGIISAMHVLIIFLYGVSAVFVCIVTGMAGARILDTEQKDIGIYKSIGCSVEMLRLSFALRFGLVAAVGAVIGTLAAVCFTDVIVSSVMRLAGISNFASGNTTGSILVPGLAITFLFLWFAWLLAGRIRNPKGYLYGHTT